MFGEKEDLFQAGYLGLIKAYKNFDPDKGVKFSTYAYDYIYGEMYEVSNQRLIKINKKNLKLYKSFTLARDKLIQKHGKDFSIKEVCNYLKVDYHKIYSIFTSLNNYISLDGLIVKDKSSNLDELILLKDALSSLSDLEKRVINETIIYDKNQKEVAKSLGLSQATISRILKTSTKRIKSYVSLI